MTGHQVWTYRGGDWLGVFGEHTAVVLPPSERVRAARLWELVDAGAGIDAVLDELVSAGLSGLPAFVLLSRAGDQTWALVRGTPCVHLATPDEVVHLDGTEAATWVERTCTGVTRIRVEVTEQAAPDDLVVTGGLVRISTAEQQTASPPTVDPDRDGDTRAGGLGPVILGAPPPGIPGQPPAPPVTAQPVARLLVSEGETVAVDRTVLVGRAPEARRTDDVEPHLVAVASPHHEISSTHLEVRPGSGADHGSAVVTDLGSTNGTLLVQPGLPPEDLKAGVAVQLLPGAVLDLGDGVTIQVVNP